MTTRARIAVTLLTATALCAAAFGLHRWRQFTNLEDAKAVLRQDGIPLTGDEFYAKYPEATDVASRMETILGHIDAIRESPDGERILPLTTTPKGTTFLPNDAARVDSNQLSAYLAAQEAPLAELRTLIHELAPSPAMGCVPIFPDRNQMNTFRHAAELLVLRVQVRLREGDVDGALDDVVLLRKVSDANLQAGYARALVGAKPAEAAALVFSWSALTPEQLDVLDQVWHEGYERIGLQIWIERSLCADFDRPIAGLIETWEKHYKLDPPAGEYDPPIMDRFVQFLCAPRRSTYWLHEPGDAAFTLYTFRHYLALYEQPPEMWNAESERFVEKLKSAPWAYHRTRSALFSPYPARRAVNDVAWTRVVKTAIAVERYRHAHDTLPAALGELVPKYLDAVPIDPWDSHPIGYTVLTERHYIVSSSGEPTRRRGLGGVEVSPDVPEIEVMHP